MNMTTLGVEVNFKQPYLFDFSGKFEYNPKRHNPWCIFQGNSYLLYKKKEWWWNCYSVNLYFEVLWIVKVYPRCVWCRNFAKNSKQHGALFQSLSYKNCKLQSAHDFTVKRSFLGRKWRVDVPVLVEKMAAVDIDVPVDADPQICSPVDLER